MSVYSSTNPVNQNPGDNYVMESRVKTFISTVQQNVRNELSDIFDEEQPNNNDVVMSMDGRRRGRDRRRRTRRRIKKESSNSSDGNENKNGVRADNRDGATKTAETVDAINEFTLIDADVPIEEKSNIDETTAEEIQSIIEETKASLSESGEDVDAENDERVAQVGQVDQADQAEHFDHDVSPAVIAELEAIYEEIQNDLTSLDENSLEQPNMEDIINDSAINNDQKNETENHNHKVANNVINTPSTKDLSTENILEVVMSANGNDKELMVARLKEILRVNEDLKVISALSPQEKLWVEQKEVPENLRAGDGADTYDALAVYESYTWAADALKRTYYGQGREKVLTHITGLVDTIEGQTSYTDVLTKKDYIGSYIKMIRDAATIIERNMTQQYDNMQVEIEDIVTRMRAAADTMEGIYSAGNA